MICWFKRNETTDATPLFGIDEIKFSTEQMFQFFLVSGIAYYKIDSQNWKFCFIYSYRKEKHSHTHIRIVEHERNKNVIAIIKNKQ